MIEGTIIALTMLALFLISTASVSLVAKRNFKKKIVGNDINKKGAPLVAESCGGALIAAFWILIILANYLFWIDYRLIIVGACVSVFALIGFFDDNKHKFLSKPMGWKKRAVPIAIASLFLAGILFVPTDLLSALWVLVLALFFAGLASFSNTFEGLNGWTVGSSLIMTIILSIAALQINQELSFLFASLAAIILGLLIFNRYPTRAFPGDSGTLLIGSAIAGIALFSQNILFVVLCFLFFIPHMIDFFILKMITNKDDASQHKYKPYKLLANGKLTIPDYKDKHERLDFAKLLFKIFGPMREWQVVLIIWVIVAINAIFWTAVFLNLKLI